MYSRRDFGKLALLSAPLAALKSAPADGATTAATPIGVTTFSFRDLPQKGGRDRLGRVLDSLKAVGATTIELHSVDTESPEPIGGLPKPQTGGAYGGMTVELTPAELAHIKLANRNNLRHWRLETKPAVYESMRDRFDSAGVKITAYRVDYDDAFTDDEIVATFAQSKTLGAGVISSAASIAMARRLAPLADAHHVVIAFRNSSPKDGDMALPASLSSALALSKNFRVALDIGAFTASNQQAVAYIQENHAVISHIVVKDRTRDGGGNEEFGNGDTPIKPVMHLLKEKQFAVPAFVEYEYLGVGTPEAEVKRCLAYVKAALA
ncbi:MAG TPA: hypothetical protein VHW24_17950 [Bryobacteraceae bacterium]|nr:hypothetical protein [Bryobacteraceae bacterium]